MGGGTQATVARLIPFGFIGQWPVTHPSPLPPPLSEAELKRGVLELVMKDHSLTADDEKIYWEERGVVDLVRGVRETVMGGLDHRRPRRSIRQRSALPSLSCVISTLSSLWPSLLPPQVRYTCTVRSGGVDEWEVLDGLRRAGLPESVEDEEAEAGEVCERLTRHLEDRRMRVRDLFRLNFDPTGRVWHHSHSESHSDMAPSLPLVVLAERMYSLSGPTARRMIASSVKRTGRE